MFPTTAKCIHFVRKCFLCSCIRQMCRTSCRMSEPFTCSVSRTKFFPSFRRRQHRLPKIKTSSFSISFLSHSELEPNSKVFFWGLWRRRSTHFTSFPRNVTQRTKKHFDDHQMWKINFNYFEPSLERQEFENSNETPMDERDSSSTRLFNVALFGTNFLIPDVVTFGSETSRNRLKSIFASTSSLLLTIFQFQFSVVYTFRFQFVGRLI